MSTENPKPQSGNAVGRYFFMLLLGLVLGAIATVMITNTLQARKDHFPESIMTVMSWHMDQLKGNVEANRCTATDTIPHLQSLRRMADNLEPGFKATADADAKFGQHASSLRNTLDGALSAPPSTCESLKKVMAQIGDGCKTCHQDFKK